MKTLKAIALLIAVLLLGAAPVIAQTVTFFPMSAPIESTAASVSRTNVANMLKNGATTWGTLGTPGYVDASDDQIAVAEIISTPTFASWHGYANPGSEFGAGFSAQLGNVYRNPFIITKGASQFSLSQVTGTTTVSGPISNTGALPFISYNSSTTIGVLFGLNGVLGGGDDTYITSGATTQLVDALIYNAASNSFTVSPTGATEQDRLNQTFSNLTGLSIETQVFLNSVLIGDHVQAFDASSPVGAVPEPSAATAFLGLCAIGLALVHRRTRKI